MREEHHGPALFVGCGFGRIVCDLVKEGGCAAVRERGELLPREDESRVRRRFVAFAIRTDPEPRSALRDVEREGVAVRVGPGHLRTQVVEQHTQDVGSIGAEEVISELEARGHVIVGLGEAHHAPETDLVEFVAGLEEIGVGGGVDAARFELAKEPGTVVEEPLVIARCVAGVGFCASNEPVVLVVRLGSGARDVQSPCVTRGVVDQLGDGRDDTRYDVGGIEGENGASEVEKVRDGGEHGGGGVLGHATGSFVFFLPVSGKVLP